MTAIADLSRQIQLNNAQASVSRDWATITMPKLGDPCANCGERKSTDWWVGESGALALTHGWQRPWCKVCVLTEQLKYARKLARRIPSLEKKLARAKKAAK